MKKRIVSILLIILAISSILFTGCTRKVGWISSENNHRTWATYKYFSGTDTKGIRVHEGDTLVINFESEVGKGSLSMTIEDPEGHCVFTMEPGEEGTGKVEIDQSGKYTLIIDGEETSGKFDINWSFE